jgi:hypothetical protein
LLAAGEDRSHGPAWFSPGGRELLHIDTEGQVVRFDAATCEEVGRFNTKSGAVRNFTVSADGRVFAVHGAASEKVKVIDTGTGKVLTERMLDTGAPAVEMALSPDGRSLALADWNTLICWDTSTGKERCRGQWNQPAQTTLAFAAVTGQLIVARASQLLLLNPTGGAVLRRLPMTPGSFLRGISSDGKTVCLTDGSMATLPPGSALPREWTDLMLVETLTAGKRVPRIAHQRHVTTAAFSPDGRLFASADFCGTIRLWDTVAGVEVAAWPGHRCYIVSLAFSPDGRLLASSGVDTTVVLWNVPELVRRPKPDAPQWERTWEDLASADGSGAWQAMSRLVLDPDRAVKLLQERLQKRKEYDLPRLLADLDDDEYEVRERASEALARLGVEARQFLLRSLEGKLSLEQQKRVCELLQRDTITGVSLESLRRVRAVEVLERIGTPAARAVLAEVERWGSGDWASADAAAARQRLTARDRP